MTDDIMAELARCGADRILADQGGPSISRRWRRPSVPVQANPAPIAGCPAPPRYRALRMVSWRRPILRFHAVADGETQRTLCGQYPACGFSEHAGDRVDCPRCLELLKRLGEQKAS